MYHCIVDALLDSDRQIAQALTPAEKLAQALDLMSMGIALKRANLRREHPDADESEIERLWSAWLIQDG